MFNFEKNKNILMEYFPEERKTFWKNIEKFENSKIDILDGIDYFNPNVNYEFNKKILLSHFGFSKYELEALGLPIYLTKMLPNAKIDITYHKNQKIDKIYKINIESRKCDQINNLEEKYDFIIGRSSSLIKLWNNYRNIYNKSGPKINIQTNNLSSNMFNADYFFDIQEFFAPADPVFVNYSKNTLEKSKKKNIIVFSGTVFWEKGQKFWFDKVDKDLLNEYEIYIAGRIDDIGHAKDIQSVCVKKNIKNVRFLGLVPNMFMADLMCLSKIHIMNHDSRPIQHPLGLSRTHGEGLACQSFPLTPIKTVKIPPEWSGLGMQYDHEDSYSLNFMLDKAIKITKDYEKINWNCFGFTQMCNRIFEKTISLT